MSPSGTWSPIWPSRSSARPTRQTKFRGRFTSISRRESSRLGHLSRAGEIYVYASPTQIQVARLGQELDGGDLLPGFRLPLRSCSRMIPSDAGVTISNDTIDRSRAQTMPTTTDIAIPALNRLADRLSRETRAEVYFDRGNARAVCDRRQPLPDRAAGRRRAQDGRRRRRHRVDRRRRARADRAARGRHQPLGPDHRRRRSSSTSPSI